MKIKKYMNIFLIFLFVFIIQTIYFEYIFSVHKQQMTDLQISLNENIYNFNNRMQNLEEEILSSTQKSFVNSHKIPNTIYFCGEKINISDPFMRESVEREFYSLLNKQGQIQLYLKRLGRYGELIESHLKQAGLSNDLKYLSVHESALLPTIRSQSRAVGLWQFMSSSAQLYGLKINRYIDERCDPEKATPAAIKYLKDLHKRFGTWSLALAAYNGGPSRVSKSMQHQNADDFFDLSLPEETERYYFKIVAAKIILSNPDKYGFKMTKNDYYYPHPTQKIEFTIFESRKYLDEVADICNINLSTLKALNPSIKANYLPVGKYTLKIYTEEFAAFQQNYNKYLDSLGMLAKVNNEVNKKSMVD
jgi:membrane-bound lytic murein transglycosylase D